MWIVWLEKKILKTLGILLGIILILIISLHIYLVNNAEYLLSELVRTRSNNKLGLKVKNISFNYFSNKIGLEKISFYSNDTSQINTAYRFDVDKIQIRVNGLIPIFTKKQLVIDSLFISSPQIFVTQLKKPDTGKKDVSIPAEMGRVYNSIIDALRLLHVSRFELRDGQFTLNNKIRPDAKPLRITNLDIHIDNLNIDSTGNAGELLEGGEMEFKTTKQDIIFPDGDHRLAFSNFRINIREKQVEIDSCTLYGKQPDNERAGYTIFLDTLKLVNVNFKSLYEFELVKADSVYCLHPHIDLTLELKKRTGSDNIPNMDTIIHDLTGNMDLKYIGVKNADLNLTTYNNDRPSTFTSHNNNFEMEELVIDHSLPDPISLKSFSTAIRNYENFIKDSSYFLRFDSILLKEKQVLLSNFSINSEAYRDTRNIRVRRFALSGLSWEDLLFNRKIKARQATLYDPFIDYTQPETKRKNAKSLLASLEGIYKIMDLDKLQMLNGQIKVVTREKDQILLQNADLLITMPAPGTIDEVNELETVIDELYFEKGIFRIKNIVAISDNSYYSGNNNQLSFDKLNVYDRNQSIYVSARNVRLDSLSYNDSLKKLRSDGLYWSQGKLELNQDTVKGQKFRDSLSFEIKKTEIYNTTVEVNKTGSSLNLLLAGMTTGPINKNEDLRIETLKAIGKQLSWFKPGTEINFSDFTLADDSPSVINSFYLKQENENKSAEYKIPELKFIPHVESLLTGKPVFDSVYVNSPDIWLNTKAKPDAGPGMEFPDLVIKDLVIDKPVVNISNELENKKGISWNGRQNAIGLKNIVFDKQFATATVDSVAGSISQLSIIGAGGKAKSTGGGKIAYQLDGVRIINNKKPDWAFRVKDVSATGFSFDSLGKNNGILDLQFAKAENLQVNSDNIQNIKDLVSTNQFFKVGNITGSYTTPKNKLNWENFSFNRFEKRITLDSFSFIPVKSRDEFIFSSPWQTDYMTISSGALTIEDADIDRYLTDSTIRARSLNINNALFTTYRDKRPPFHEGIIKPLPSKLLQKIPLKLFIDTLNFENGKAIYTELNDKTGRTGVVPVTRISGDVFPIKNTEIAPLDTFRIRLNGFILDTAWIRLRTRESFTDSLSGFIITLRMKPQSLLYLNEILDPLAGLTLKSGYLDTLNMRAIGKDNLSLGEMKMFYHDLKVEFQRNGSEEKKRFLRGLKTFIANSFVIKNENKKRTGVVYFPRLRDRSFINYYIKIAFSGIASSVGAKKNRKVLRKYRKELKIRKLPPIDF